ncbi:MAG: hypothetical protein GF332_01630 [Candidatus Moranbacteria bacterium]|nr:hypothetical protein [Candidatus Moranbacteria bacterium]
MVNIEKIKTIATSATLIIIGIFFVLPASASALTSFSFDVPEGQGASNNEFYTGRCVRADVLLDTDGHDAGGADLIINYSNTDIQIVESDCATPATTIYEGASEASGDELFDNHIFNNVNPSSITLGAYNNFGNVYNGSGVYAHFYFLVLSQSGSYDLDFDFTLGNTLDCNLSEAGTGADILEQANDYTLNLVPDPIGDLPYITDQTPADGATDVAVTSNVSLRINDDASGVDIANTTITLDGINYTSSGPNSFSYTCHTTNFNRVDYCDITINPSSNFNYGALYLVDVDTYDLGEPTANHLSVSYSFTTETDNDSPYIYNLNPGSGATNVATNSNISFNIGDIANPGGYPGLGVDLSSIQVVVSAPGWGSQTYINGDSEFNAIANSANDYGDVYDYSIEINPESDFPQNTIVSIQVVADDLSSPANVLNTSYSFTTTDTDQPICSNFSPVKNSAAMSSNGNIIFECTDSGSGINIDSLSVLLDGNVYTSNGANTFDYSGDASAYTITIDPVNEIVSQYAFEVVIDVNDFNNNSARYSYGLAAGTGAATCEECEECEECDDCDQECEPETETIIKYIEKESTDYKDGNCQDLESSDTSPSQNLTESASEKSIFIKTTDPTSFTLEKINEMLVGGENIEVNSTEDQVIFTGTASPDSSFTLMIESLATKKQGIGSTLILNGMADQTGNWKIAIKNVFTQGMHDVSLILNNREDGSQLDKKRLSQFEVKTKKEICWLCIVIIFLVLLNIIQFLTRNSKKNKNVANQ